MSSDHFYRDLDSSLPDIGWTGSMPRRPSAEAARQIEACDNAVALGAMLGAARAFWGSAGGIAIAAFGGAALAAVGWDIPAAIVLSCGAIVTLGWIETRRRARQWQGLIEGRLAGLRG